MKKATTPNADDILGGRVEKIGEVWYWTKFHVCYSQTPMSTSKNFARLEDAVAEFDRRLASIRSCWGPNGFIETDESQSENSRLIRFQSKLKTGKPGRIKGTLSLSKIPEGTWKTS